MNRQSDYPWVYTQGHVYRMHPVSGTLLGTSPHLQSKVSIASPGYSMFARIPKRTTTPLLGRARNQRRKCQSLVLDASCLPESQSEPPLVCRFWQSIQEFHIFDCHTIFVTRPNASSTPSMENTFFTIIIFSLG